MIQFQEISISTDAFMLDHVLDYIITKYKSKGSLQEIIKNKRRFKQTNNAKLPCYILYRRSTIVSLETFSL